MKSHSGRRAKCAWLEDDMGGKARQKAIESCSDKMFLDWGCDKERMNEPTLYSGKSVTKDENNYLEKEEV